jgi:hypothetical protein
MMNSAFRLNAKSAKEKSPGSEVLNSQILERQKGGVIMHI